MLSFGLLLWYRPYPCFCFARCKASSSQEMSSDALVETARERTLRKEEQEERTQRWVEKRVGTPWFPIAGKELREAFETTPVEIKDPKARQMWHNLLHSFHGTMNRTCFEREQGIDHTPRPLCYPTTTVNVAIVGVWHWLTEVLGILATAGPDEKRDDVMRCMDRMGAQSFEGYAPDEVRPRGAKDPSKEARETQRKRAEARIGKK